MEKKRLTRDDIDLIADIVSKYMRKECPEALKDVDYPDVLRAISTVMLADECIEVSGCRVKVVRC